MPGSSRSAGSARETANASTTAVTEMQKEPGNSVPYMVSIAPHRDPSQCRASLHSRNERRHSAPVGRAVGLDAERALRPTFANCFVLAKSKPRSIWTGVGEAVLFAAGYDCDWAALMSSLACLVAFLLSALPFTLGSSC
jgi:hypothetical protein